MSAVTEQPGLGAGGKGGLGLLAALESLQVNQQVEMCEAVTGFEQKNKYQICDSRGSQVFYLKEETACCTRQCCGPARPFQFSLTDPAGVETLRLERDCVCAPCGWPNMFCCLCPVPCSEQRMSVLSEGRELGSVSLQRTFFTPTIKVADQAGNTVYTLVSQTCQCSCGDDIDYRILDPNRGEEIGTITKQYNGCCKEIFTDADNFGINFPVGADTNQKALLLGATLMIDFLFFEYKNDN